MEHGITFLEINFERKMHSSIILGLQVFLGDVLGLQGDGLMRTARHYVRISPFLTNITKRNTPDWSNGRLMFI